MRELRKWLIENFGFSQTESKGFSIFLFLTVVFFIISFFLPQRIFNSAAVESVDASISIEKFLSKENDTHSKLRKTIHVRSDISLDPNFMDFSDWQSLGIDKTLSNRIISYRLKGGYFSNLEDLNKIYGFDEDKLEKIRQFLKVSPLLKGSKPNAPIEYEPKPRVYTHKAEKYEPKHSSININICDSSELLFIKYIGPKRASRIVKYREKLGGFNSIEQLAEVYGMDSLSLQTLEATGFIDSLFQIRRLNINNADFKEILAHPYFNYNQTKVICNYRNQHGPFQSTEDFLKVKILTPEWISKIEPYIQF